MRCDRVRPWNGTWRRCCWSLRPSWSSSLVIRARPCLFKAKLDLWVDSSLDSHRKVRCDLDTYILLGRYVSGAGPRVDHKKASPQSRYRRRRWSGCVHPLATPPITLTPCQRTASRRPPRRWRCYSRTTPTYPSVPSFPTSKCDWSVRAREGWAYDICAVCYWRRSLVHACRVARCCRSSPRSKARARYGSASCRSLTPDGWFRTRDIAIIDRRKELIKYKVSTHTYLRQSRFHVTPTRFLIGFPRRLDSHMALTCHVLLMDGAHSYVDDDTGTGFPLKSCHYIGQGVEV